MKVSRYLCDDAYTLIWLSHHSFLLSSSLLSSTVYHRILCGHVLIRYNVVGNAQNGKAI